MQDDPLLRPFRGRSTDLSRQGRGRTDPRQSRLHQAVCGESAGCGHHQEARARRHRQGGAGRDRGSGSGGQSRPAAFGKGPHDRCLCDLLRGDWEMARKISIRQALNEALDQEMARDPTVFVMGEDIVGGMGGDGDKDAWGGVLGVTKGLYAKYGDRLLDTPLSESAYIGAAIGAAACGMRPVAELMFIDFMGVRFDQIYNQPAKFRYMFGGQAQTPVTVRAMVGAGFRAAAQHSQMLTPIVTHIPGLKVVCPSNPYDTKGLLAASIRDNDPVIFCEHKAMYDQTGEVPEGPYTIPLGEADV